MPGAPHSSTPAGVLAPIRRKRSGSLRNVTSSMISDLTCAVAVAVRLVAAKSFLRADEQGSQLLPARDMAKQ